MEKTRKPRRRLATKILLALVTAIGFALSYVLLLLVTSDAPAAPQPTAQPVAASPAMRASGTEDLAAMVNAFPGALLAAKNGEGLTLLGAESHDTAWRGVWARVAEAVYADEEGRQLHLFSFYPGEALGLMDRRGWQMTAQAGPEVSGCATAVMKRGGETMLLLSHGAGAYAVQIPAGVNIEDAAGPLQLYSSGGDAQ